MVILLHLITSILFLTKMLSMQVSMLGLLLDRFITFFLGVDNRQIIMLHVK